MKHIHVSCALIEKNGKVLAVQRSERMSMPLKWEFPGGKLDPGEAHEDCLKREVLEELGIEIAVREPLTPVTHQYPDFRVTLYPFICTIRSGEIVLHEHTAQAWLLPGELQKPDWAEADGPIVEEYTAIRRSESRDFRNSKRT
jgi:8-oxo-dGTP diphosphatase